MTALAAVFVVFGVWSVLRAHAKPGSSALVDQAIEIVATPIAHFRKGAPEQTAFGRLTWRGGLVLTSPSPLFGGWSGLAVDKDGRRVLAVSDTGVWLAGRLTYEGARPTGVAEARLGPLLDLAGQPLRGSREVDAEGLALLSGTLAQGEVLVSFERNHRIWRYPVTAAGMGRPIAAVPVPTETAVLEPNKSLEAVCVLERGGQRGIATFAERFPGKGGLHVGWWRPLGEGAGKPGPLPGPGSDNGWSRLNLTVIDGYDVTDCAGLPDGGMLILERRFRVSYGDPLTGPRLRIRRIAPEDFATATPMVGETLLDVGMDHEIDNMEGLAVHAEPDGRLVMTLISDDNFNSYIQRTVLLQFALEAPAPRAAGSPPVVSQPSR